MLFFFKYIFFLFFFLLILLFNIMNYIPLLNRLSNTMINPNSQELIFFDSGSLDAINNDVSLRIQQDSLPQIFLPFHEFVHFDNNPILQQSSIINGITAANEQSFNEDIMNCPNSSSSLESIVVDNNDNTFFSIANNNNENVNSNVINTNINITNNCDRMNNYATNNMINMGYIYMNNVYDINNTYDMNRIYGINNVINNMNNLNDMNNTDNTCINENHDDDDDNNKNDSNNNNNDNFSISDNFNNNDNYSNNNRNNINNNNIDNNCNDNNRILSIDQLKDSSNQISSTKSTNQNKPKKRKINKNNKKSKTKNKKPRSKKPNIILQRHIINKEFLSNTKKVQLALEKFKQLKKSRAKDKVEAKKEETVIDKNNGKESNKKSEVPVHKKIEELKMNFNLSFNRLKQQLSNNILKIKQTNINNATTNINNNNINNNKKNLTVTTNNNNNNNE